MAVEYSASNLFLWFRNVLLLLLGNLLVLSLLQPLWEYPFKTVQEVMTPYAGYDLLDTAQIESLSSSLFQTPEGMLLVTARHHKAFDRWQLLQEDAVADGDTLPLTGSSVRQTVTIRNHQIQYGSATPIRQPSIWSTSLVGMALGLLILEGLLWMVYSKVFRS